MVPINMEDISEKLKDIRKLSVSDIAKTVNHKTISKKDFIQKSTKSTIKDLGPEMKSVLAEESIRKAVKKYGVQEEGLTIDEIMKITGLARKTVDKHLNTLSKLREIYSVKKGKRMTLYFPNGKPLWGVGTQRFEWGPSIFEVTLARGPNKKLFFHILEKRYSILDGERPEGGILLPKEGLDDFIKGLKKMSNKVEVEKNVE